MQRGRTPPGIGIGFGNAHRWAACCRKAPSIAPPRSGS